MSTANDYAPIVVSDSTLQIVVPITWPFDNTVAGLVATARKDSDGTFATATVLEIDTVGSVSATIENPFGAGVAIELTVQRITERTQEYSQPDGEALDPYALEAQLDKIVRYQQEVSIPQGETAISSVDGFSIPDKTTRADSVLGFDEDGEVELVTGLLPVLVESVLYVDFSGGDDTTGDGTIGLPWKTLQFALDYLDGKTLTQFTNIICRSGVHDIAAPITLNHPQGQYIAISGEGIGVTTLNLLVANTLFTVENQRHFSGLDQFSVTFDTVSASNEFLRMGVLSSLNNLTSINVNCNTGDGVIQDNLSRIGSILSLVMTNFGIGIDQLRAARIGSIIGGTLEGGTVGVPAGIAIRSALGSCVESIELQLNLTYNNYGIFVQENSEILLHNIATTAAVVNTGNNADTNIALSTLNVITYGEDFSRILYTPLAV